jgi:hypothetical protein
MMPRMNQGAALPMACSAMPPMLYAVDPRSLNTIAAALQKDMKESMIVAEQHRRESLPGSVVMVLLAMFCCLFRADLPPLM